MKPFPHSNSGSRKKAPTDAFTLIEMLVVIGIIGLLAAMIVPLAGVVARKRIVARAQVQLNNLELAINTYKAKKGVYPPDNPTQPAGAFRNQLFYELWGMIVQNPPAANPIFTNTFNASETIDGMTLSRFFGNGTSPLGINNASVDTNDIINFYRTLKAVDIQNINTAAQPVWVFALPSPGPTNNLPVPPISGSPPVNVFRYVSSNPTNNPTTFDLWIDVLIAGKTNRISNWSKDPEIVNY